MAHAQNISIAMTVAGLVLTALGFVADLGPFISLTGMLLFVAGIVKIATVAIWRSFFSIPVDAPARSEGPPASGGEQGKV